MWLARRRHAPNMRGMSFKLLLSEPFYRCLAKAIVVTVVVVVKDVLAEITVVICLKQLAVKLLMWFFSPL
jgi:hypothetical protein